MIWQKIGNKWFDKWIERVMELHEQLGSVACSSSPLDYLEVETLEKAFKKINKINLKVAKRMNKEEKKK